MAQVNPTVTTYENYVVVTWSGVNGGDTCLGVSLVGYPDKTIHAIGSFGTSTGSVKGSNQDADGLPDANWQSLTDPQGVAIALQTTPLEVISENPLWLAPVISSGTAAGLAIVLVASRQRQQR